ncbi:MAG: hypothetical protein CEE42_03270 [Promethearchaeota archaeon Loki_b31]|nr:MAG: hypothetical protein CEE42_03270 [Candidatus Lokiarchaeota archaeon Loki_b31]
MILQNIMSEKAFGFKIIIIGAPAVGKTSLIKKYTTDSFQKSYISTLGTQFSKYEEDVDGEKVELFIWDIAGQDSFNVMRQKFYTGSSGAIIVFSHASEQTTSFNLVDKWLNELKEHCGNIPIVLFGNKIDLIDENDLSLNKDKATSDYNVGKYVIDNRFLGYFKNSALTGQGVIEAFQALVRKLYLRAKM